MNKINVCIQEELAKTYKYNVKDIPLFTFMPLDMTGRKALREACTELWQQGLVSTRTMMETQGYSLDKEKAQREKEKEDGTDEVMQPRDTQAGSAESDPNNDNVKIGRPTVDDDERESDPENAIRSKQPKPSNPDGSESEEDGS